MTSQLLSIWSRIPHEGTLVSPARAQSRKTPEENLPLGPCASLGEFQSKQSRQWPEMFSQVSHKTSLMDPHCPWGKRCAEPFTNAPECQTGITAMDSSQEPLHRGFSFLESPRCLNVFLVPQGLGKQGLSERLAGHQHPSSSQGTSVTPISSEWLPGDRCPLPHVPGMGTSCSGPVLALVQGQGTAETLCEDKGPGELQAMAARARAGV